MSAEEVDTAATFHGIQLEDWRSADNATGYMGVSVHGSRYQATIKCAGKSTCLGSFDTLKEAALVHAREHIRLHGKPTPQAEQVVMTADQAKSAAKAEGIDLDEWRADNASGYKGVKVGRSKYEARVRYAGKLKYLGIYATAEEAALVCAREHVRLHSTAAQLEASSPPRPPSPASQPTLACRGTPLRRGRRAGHRRRNGSVRHLPRRLSPSPSLTSMSPHLAPL
jgi:hypothetical protein